MIGKIFDFGEKILDLIPNSQDKAKAKTMIMEAENKAQNELTKRLQADMQSDSWLSKNIRPISLIFLLVLYASQCYLNHSSIGTTQQLLMTVFSFYFGSRGIEKIFNITKGKK